MSNTIVSQVYETTDYAQFKFLDGNRVTKKANLKRLENSIKEEYLMSPILVNEKMEIIDGQHRFKIANKLSIPIRYIKAPGYGLKQVQRLNTNMSNWKQTDYLHAYCELGYPEYIKFREFMEDYPQFTFEASKMILINKSTATKSTTSKDAVTATNRSGSHLVKFFEEGLLIIPDYNLSCLYAEILLSISNYYDGFSRKTFVATFITLMKSGQFDYKRFIHKLSVCPIKLDHRSNVGQYKELIEDIYNWHTSNKTSLKYL